MSAPAAQVPPDTTAPRWRLLLCGQARAVSAQEEQVLLEWRDAAALALLAIEGPMARSRLIALLWPDLTPDQVRGRLRQRLYVLKTKLGVEAVTGSQTLALSPQLQWAGLAQEAEGALLGEDEHADLPEFASWLQAMRSRLQILRRERLAGESSALESEGRLAEAIVAAERLLALEPLQEHAHRRLMRLHYLRGDRAAALLAFDRCERVLKDEVGAKPCTETLDLLAQIERAQPVAPGTGQPARRIVPASVLRPPRLIGRDAEWAQLQDAWQAGHAIVVIGEGGLGKTRLIGDLVRANAPGPGQTVQVAARPGDERVPYALLVRLLRGLLASHTAPLPAGVEIELSRLLPELPQRAQVSSDAQASARFIAAIEATVNAAVGAGLEAVALDDLHFADAASLEMAQHLAGASGLRWLAAFRQADVSAPGEALLETLVGRLHAESIVLRPLTLHQVTELVASLGIEGLNAHSLADALHRRSGGNPMFLLETLKALLLSDQAGGADVRRLARLPIEGSSLRLIERRIGQLSRDAVRLARCAAIAGQDFSASLAARVLDVNPLDLADAWQELESAQVLSGGAFAHDLIFEAARASVPEPIACALHGRIAELLAADSAEPAQLATHWLGAGEDHRAAPYLAEAGRQALRAMRIREGVEYLDRAQSIYGEAGDADAQCALIDQMISSAVYAGSFDQVDRLVQQAVGHATTPRQRSMALRSLASLQGHRGEFELAGETARVALEQALVACDRACELGARCLLAEVLSEYGREGEAEAILKPIEPWVHRHGDAQQRLTYADALAKVLQDTGQVADALAQWDRAIDIARSVGAAHALPNLMGQRAITMLMSGKTLAARDAMLECRQLLRDAPEEAMMLRVISQRLQVMERSLGHYASCLSLGECILEDPAASPAEIDEARLCMANAFRDLGQPARVRRLLEQVPPECDVYRNLSWGDLRAQLLQPASQQAEARLRLLEAAEQGVAKWSKRSLLVPWRVQAMHAADDVAVAAARQAANYASASGLHGQRMLFQALLARHLSRRGESAEAVGLAKDSWRLMSEFNPGIVYRGVVWHALVEVLEPHDATLARKIAHAAADWIYRTAAEHVPPAYRESFLHRNTANQYLLAKVCEG